MTLRNHYYCHSKFLKNAHACAFLRDKIEIDLRFGRIPRAHASDAITLLNRYIIENLTEVQKHATEIEHQEALFIARQERAFYDAVIYSIAIPNPPPAIGVPRSLTEEDKRQIAREAKAAKQRQYRHDKAARQPVSRDYCGRCQATGIDPLSADGVHLNCRACAGTGLAETETEEAAA